MVWYLKREASSDPISFEVKRNEHSIIWAVILWELEPAKKLYNLYKNVVGNVQTFEKLMIWLKHDKFWKKFKKKIITILDETWKNL